MSITLDDFILLFNGEPVAENRWGKLSRMIPRDDIETVCARSMSPNNEARAIDARIACGTLHVKENENLSNEKTAETIAENPYTQYSLGLREYAHSHCLSCR